MNQHPRDTLCVIFTQNGQLDFTAQICQKMELGFIQKTNFGIILIYAICFSNSQAKTINVSRIHLYHFDFRERPDQCL